MPVKVTMFFTAENYSWSEAHYYLQGGAFQAALAPAIQLATLRTAVLGDYAALVAVRLSSVPANRQVYEIPASNWPGLVTETGGFLGTFSSDQPFVALMINMTAPTANKNLYLSGIPDNTVVVNPAYPNGYDPSGVFTTALNSYMTYLAPGNTGSSAWGFRSQQSFVGIPVAAVGTQSGYNNDIGLQTLFNPNVPAGQDARLVGFRTINPRVPNLSGSYRVAAVIPPSSGVATWTTVLSQTGNVSPTNFFALGSITPLTYNYVPYQNWRVVRATHRKRGGSYGRPRGRSRVRR